MIIKNKLLYILTGIAVSSIAITSCTKFTEIDLPGTRISSEAAFIDDAAATSTLAGLYTKLTTSNLASGRATVFAGIAADELIRYGANDNYQQIANNAISPDNPETESIWTGTYGIIAQANACIEGLATATGVTPATRKQLTGEALFVRAFCYFYLNQFYGEVPLNISTDWASQSSLGRASVEQVHQQMLRDLKAAKDSLSTTKRVKATRLAANALLARLYLYKQQYDSARTYATAVIEDNAMPKVLPDLNSVFLIESSEAIFKLIPGFGAAAVPEVSQFVNAPRVPITYLTKQLEESFEPNDKRKTNWIYTYTFNGTAYSYPYKYKSNSFSSFAEHYVALRLAEQYLIRAEARAQENDIAGAVNDLNVVRVRAGVNQLNAATMGQTQVLNAVAAERRAELFAEWGHRWFDLVRTNQAKTVVGALKPTTWKDYAVLFPVPEKERQKTPFLSQNFGYPQ